MALANFDSEFYIELSKIKGYSKKILNKSVEENMIFDDFIFNPPLAVLSVGTFHAVV
jgi:hypothetical protein